MENVKKVYGAIVNVAAAMAKHGISKDKKNSGQGYMFRGIDDVYNALSSILSENKLCILPKMKNRMCEERQAKSGSATFYVNVEADFDFVCAEDGSIHTVTMFGEAMDSADKATNKAMSAAYKYACMQAFCIPTQGDNDADASDHNVKYKSKSDVQKPKAANDINIDALITKVSTFGTLVELTRFYNCQPEEVRQDIKFKTACTMQRELIENANKKAAEKPAEKTQAEIDAEEKRLLDEDFARSQAKETLENAA